jgi:hypothetical protein
MAARTVVFHSPISILLHTSNSWKWPFELGETRGDQESVRATKDSMTKALRRASPQISRLGKPNAWGGPRPGRVMKEKVAWAWLLEFDVTPVTPVASHVPRRSGVNGEYKSA